MIDKNAILCTDSSAVYKAFCKELGISYDVIHSQCPRVRGAFHIQNVNASDSRLKGWMHRFYGVATKYLGSYLGWRRMLERYRTGITPEGCLLEAAGRMPQQLIQTSPNQCPNIHKKKLKSCA